ncbi:MAG: helix-turn-helix domain-containing protein [Armatimonadota bacterium]|nr:helix-turn-helix domain-containing protein [Armatimonadota bacterium]MDR7549385.1 helix-turn-helix domain-containing protein [Armatimonadota bacterium]
MRRRTDGSRTVVTGQVMTPEQVAHYLQINRLTVYRYIREGRIPASRIGKLYRIMRADVDRFLEAQKIGAKSAVLRKEAPGAAAPAPPRPAAPHPRPLQDRREVYVGPTWRERLIDRSQAARVRIGFPLEWVMRGLN